MAEFKEIDDNNLYPFEVGVLPNREMALKFADYLKGKGIWACVKPGFGAHYSVFVAHDYEVSKAKVELLRFGNNPFAKEYNQAAWKYGSTVKRQKILNSRFLSFSMGAYTWSPFTLTSIIEIVCILLFVVGLFSQSLKQEIALALAWFDLRQITQDFQVYRVITPIFLHFDFLHIAFNLVMFEAFARKIENVLGMVKLLILIVVIAVFSNYFQLIMESGNHILFGGMSGVVYGIICYMGILSRRKNLPDELRLPPGLLAVSVIFIALGFLMNNMANYCHLGGLLVGMLLGLADFRRPIKSRFR